MTRTEGPRHLATPPAAAKVGEGELGSASGTRAESASRVLGACVLLAGGLKPSPLTAAAGISTLDLFVGPGTTLLERWIGILQPLFSDLGKADIRVIHCDATPPPSAPTTRPAASVVIERDRQRYRGPAGVTRDFCDDLGPEADVLIAEGARLLGCDLAGFAADHAQSGADVTVATNPDGSPAGLYIARCSTLAMVPQRGFMDLKEQWLSRVVAAGLNVRVFMLAAPGAPALRTRAQYQRACFAMQPHATASPWHAHGFTRGVLVRGRAGNIIARGAEVDPTALLAHTIIMPGARVGAGAVVARSILCPGARINPGEEIVDAVVTADGVHFDSEANPRNPKERAR